MGLGAKRAILAGLTTFAVASFACANARADDPAIAEKLFLEGKRLSEEGKYVLACEKFKAAHDLDHTATGTLLNLALCHEQVGRNATAWAEFRQVIAESTGRRADRVAMAQQHEAKLAKLISFLVVNAPTAVHGTRIELDKSGAIAEASWGIELPVDAGPHTLVVSAPGKVSRTLTVTVGEAGDKQTVEIPALADAPPPATLTSAPEPDHAGRRTVGYALGGVGLAAIATGTVFGVLAMGRSSDADDIATKSCPNGVCADATTKRNVSDRIDQSTTFANVSNITIGVGIAAVAVGVVLVLTSRPHAKSGSTWLRSTANAFTVGSTW